MKKTKVKNAVRKLAAVLSAVICLSTMSIGSFAAMPESGAVAPANIAVVTTDNALTLGLLGKLTCEGATGVQQGYTAKVIVELQQYNGGWSTIDTWTAATGTRSAAVNEYKYVAKGYSYQLKLTHIALDSNGNQVESITKYSTIVAYN